MSANKFFPILLIAFAALALTAAEKKPWKDGSISVGDIKIHYIEAGAGDHSLVFIPGWTMTAEIWKEQIPYFASRNFHVVAMDPRSQGQTTKTEQGNTYFQHAADLVAFLKALKLDRQQTTLVGWSAAVDTLLEYISSPETGQPEHLDLVDGGPMFRKEADYPSGATIQQARTMALGFEEDRAKALNIIRRAPRGHGEDIGKGEPIIESSTCQRPTELDLLSNSKALSQISEGEHQWSVADNI